MGFVFAEANFAKHWRYSRRGPLSWPWLWLESEPCQLNGIPFLCTSGTPRKVLVATRISAQKRPGLRREELQTMPGVGPPGSLLVLRRLTVMATPIAMAPAMRHCLFTFLYTFLAVRPDRGEASYTFLKTFFVHILGRKNLGGTPREASFNCRRHLLVGDPT